MTAGRRRGIAARTTGIAIVAALAVAGCGSAAGGAAAPQGKPVQGGSLVVQMANEMRSLDPVNVSVYFTSGGDRASAVYGTLMRYDVDGNPKPDMARSMDSPDGLVWTMTLRPGATFTDGTPFDADAVVFNVNRHLAPDSLSQSKAEVGRLLAAVEAVDPQTVRFTLKQPYGSFPNYFTGDGNMGYIGSPTAIRQKGPEFGSAPVGAGPFVLQKWTRDNEMVLTRNPNYWEPGKPAIDTLTMRVIADTDTAAKDLVSGGVDVVRLEPTGYGPLLEDPGFRVYDKGGPGALALWPNTGRGPMADLGVRRAVQRAFQPDATKQVVFAGYSTWDGAFDCMPFDAGAPSCTPGTPPSPDLAAAKAATAEYFARGGTRDLAVLTTTSQAKLTTYTQQVLTELGFSVKVDIVEVPAFSPAVRKGDYDVVQGTILPFVNPTPKFSNMFSQGATNYPKQQDPQLQAALDEANGAPTAEARNAAWKRVMQQLNDQAYAFWTGPNLSMVAARATVSFGPDFPGGALWYPSDFARTE